MNDMLTEIRFWDQVMTDARRTVICPPEWESRCKGYVDARGLGGLITVRASRVCPPGSILILDEQAHQSSLNEVTAAITRMATRRVIA